jgi:hypothetical protein
LVLAYSDIRALLQALQTNEIFTEGDYQPMKIGWQKLDENHARLMPIVK